jgi:hypothetical protein
MGRRVHAVVRPQPSSLTLEPVTCAVARVRGANLIANFKPSHYADPCFIISDNVKGWKESEALR